MTVVTRPLHWESLFGAGKSAAARIVVAQRGSLRSQRPGYGENLFFLSGTPDECVRGYVFGGPGAKESRVRNVKDAEGLE